MNNVAEDLFLIARSYGGDWQSAKGGKYAECLPREYSEFMDSYIGRKWVWAFENNLGKAR